MTVKVGLVSLGCAKNLVDSEVMLGLLGQAGFAITTDELDADVLIVNTCGFIGPAKEESIEAILKLARAKKEGRCHALIVAGCLGQRYGRELVAEIPEIDAIVGTGEVGNIAGIVGEVLAGRSILAVGRPEYLYDHTAPRLLATPGYTAYLKIAEGCDNRCSYCVIPDLRGRYRSRRPESVLQEARILAGAGVREIILVAQDTTRYGQDLGGRPLLPDLLRRLGSIDGLCWIRVLYAYPSRITPELIEVLANEERVCKYLDIPVQHASPRVLREMNRPDDPERVLEVIRRLREAVPGIALRTSLIVGFPGETERDFQRLLDFLGEARFDHAGVFVYSREEDTPAGARADQVPEEIKRERYRLAMFLQRRIARERARSLVGNEVEVLVEKASKQERCIGRTYRDAPETDGRIHVAGPGSPGQFIRALVTGVRGYDLLATTERKRQWNPR